MRTWETVAIVGVGLIGGSVGRALLDRRLAQQVVGVGRRAESLRAARELGVINEFTVQMDQAVRQAELVIVCTPVERVADDVRAALQAAPPSALVTDAGSTKQVIVERVLADNAADNAARFVGSHPLAGSEKTGARFARGDLFVGRMVVVTPSELNSAEQVVTIEQFWQSLGANVVRMTPAEHDQAVAATSHLPHLAAAAVAAATPDEFLPLAATGWSDTTRVAAGDAELWRQILSENRTHVLSALEQLEQQLAGYRSALQSGDQAQLLQLLEAGKRKRDSLGS